MPSATQMAAAAPLGRLRAVLGLVKFSHSIFALPFALRRQALHFDPVVWAVAGAGAVFAVFVWRFGPALGGDARGNCPRAFLLRG